MRNKHGLLVTITGIFATLEQNSRYPICGRHFKIPPLPANLLEPLSAMSSELSPTSGFEQLRRVESSKLFQGAVITIIILSALTIGAKTYDVPPLVSQSLGILDNAITLFFLIEILFRFGVCQNKNAFCSMAGTCLIPWWSLAA